MMIRRKGRIGALLLAGMLSGTMLLGQSAVRSSVVASGATEASGGGVALRGTIGQGVVGATMNAATSALQGFWLPEGDDGSSSVVETRRGYVEARKNSVACHPNPVTSSATFTLLIAESADVQLRLFDRLGRERARLIDGRRESGLIEVELSADELESGYYVVELIVGGERSIESIMVAI